LSVDANGVNGWLERYVAAWQSSDPAEIGALFSEDAQYRYHAYDDPIVGAWLAEEDAGSFEASYACFAVEDDRAAAVGSTTYHDEGRVYDNVFLLRFDDESRCSEFTEWFDLRR
jgi:ketosteroid isomerase-like protein